MFFLSVIATKYRTFFLNICSNFSLNFIFRKARGFPLLIYAITIMYAQSVNKLMRTFYCVECAEVNPEPIEGKI